MQKLVSKLPIPGACGNGHSFTLWQRIDLALLDRYFILDRLAFRAGRMRFQVRMFFLDVLIRHPKLDTALMQLEFQLGDFGIFFGNGIRRLLGYPAQFLKTKKDGVVCRAGGDFGLHGGGDFIDQDMHLRGHGGADSTDVSAKRPYHFSGKFSAFLGGKTSSGRGSWPTFRPLSFLACAGLGFLFFAGDAHAGRKHLESWYADALAAELGAKTEVRMRNGTRCDVLAVHHAIEVEFAAKWCEAIGQALNYSSQTGRTGAVALVLESPADERFLNRMREVISWHQLPIAVVVLRPFGAKSLELQGLDGLSGRARE